MESITACRACGGGPCVERLRVHGAFPLRYVGCPRCGAFLQDPFFDRDTEREFYDRYPGLAYEPPAWETGFLEERLLRIERWTRRGRLLDIGCGRGHLVALACRRGWDAFGIEPSEQVRTRALPEVANRIRVGALEGTSEPSPVFDVATLYHVLEHLRDPRAALRRISLLLKPGGVLVVATPNAGSLVARVLRDRWAAFCMPEHCILYTARSLLRLLSLSGFRILHAGSGGQPLAFGGGAAGSVGPLRAARRAALRLAGGRAMLRRFLRRGVSDLGLGDAIEVFAASPGGAPT